MIEGDLSLIIFIVFNGGKKVFLKNIGRGIIYKTLLRRSVDSTY